MFGDQRHVVYSLVEQHHISINRIQNLTVCSNENKAPCTERQSETEIEIKITMCYGAQKLTLTRTRKCHSYLTHRMKLVNFQRNV